MENEMPRLLLSSGTTQRQFEIYKNITRLGAADTSDVQLEGAGVADEHAHITREQGEYFIASTGRGKTVLVNGKKEKRSKLQDGDELRLGEVEVVFTTATPKADTANTRQITSALDAYRRIVEFSEALLGADDIENLLTRLIDAVVELSHADKGFLILFEQDQPKITVARNIDQEDLPAALDQLSDSIIAKVVAERRAIIVNDALNDQEFKSSQSIINLKVSSVLCAPLLDDGQLLGIIYLGSDRLMSLFDDVVVGAVNVFASQAALLIRNALLLDGLRTDNDRLREAVKDKRYGDIIGACGLMQELFRKIRKVAPTTVSVMITGETGTGKELIARELHRNSDRSDGPFVVVNCGAIPDNLLESELFGHVRGAFTGAVATKEGRFQLANGGTLFLDEIGEMPVELQVKLLRALQERVVQKVGAVKAESIDIRVVTATNRDLDKEIEAGNFREDLFYRLNVVGLHLPPLRDRGEDLMLIARFLLQAAAEEYGVAARDFSPQAAIAMKRYEWPGNIRQLENRIKKATIMADQTQLSAEDMGLSEEDLAPVKPLADAKEEFQRSYINQILARNNGNRTKTAQDLAVDPRTVFRHLEKEAP